MLIGLRHLSIDWLYGLWSHKSLGQKSFYMRYSCNSKLEGINCSSILIKSEKSWWMKMLIIFVMFYWWLSRTGACMLEPGHQTWKVSYVLSSLNLLCKISAGFWKNTHPSIGVLRNLNLREDQLLKHTLLVFFFIFFMYIGFLCYFTSRQSYPYRSLEKKKLWYFFSQIHITVHVTKSNWTFLNVL